MNSKYEERDLQFYEDEIAPVLPDEVLDFHTHSWIASCRSVSPDDGEKLKGGRYMITVDEHPAEQLMSDGELIFPGKSYHAVIFGSPSPLADPKRTNEYVARESQGRRLYPLLITGKNTFPPADLRRTLEEGGFFGYKVRINWLGDDYGHVKVDEMIGENEMEVADELGLILMLHVPRSDRLADPDIQEGVRWLAGEYPNARIVLAHCGRCYMPKQILAAIDSIADLDNVYMDTAMIMDPFVFRVVLDRIGHKRFLFATDNPIAMMRGRRVYAMNHWVDLVQGDYPKSAFRVASDNFNATLMVYEIIKAIKQAADSAGLTEAQCREIFFENGMALLSGVMNGKMIDRKRHEWEAS